MAATKDRFSDIESAVEMLATEMVLTFRAIREELGLERHVELDYEPGRGKTKVVGVKLEPLRSGEPSLRERVEALETKAYAQ